MEIQVKYQRKGYIFELIAVFFWATVASVFKISLQTPSVAELVFYAVLTSVVALFIIVLIKKLSKDVIHILKRILK